jgi:hypothetical protein
MGWASAGGYFDAVAKALIEGGATDEVKTKVCSVLIGVFRDGDWDTEEESLGEFQDDPAIVAAFREHGIVLYCHAEGQVQDVWMSCERERDHSESTHSDMNGREWN